MGEPGQEASVNGAAKAAALALGEIQKTIRFLHLYPHDHPFCRKSLDEVTAHFGGFFERFGALEVTVEREGIKMGDALVLKDSNMSTDLSTLLYPEGIRAMTIQQGVPPVEVLDLVKILAAQYPANPEDARTSEDLATAIWRRDFSAIAFRILDPLSPARVRVAQDPETAALAKRINELTSAIETGGDVGRSAATATFLSRREGFRQKGTGSEGAKWSAVAEPPAAFLATPIAKERAALVAELSHPVQGDLWDRTLEIVAAASHDKEHGPDAEAVARFTAACALSVLVKDDLDAATNLLARVTKGAPEPPVLEAALSRRLGSEASLVALGKTIARLSAKAEPAAVADSAARFLARLGADALPGACAAFIVATDESVRAIFQGFIAAHVKEGADSIAHLTHQKPAIAEAAFGWLVLGGVGSRAYAIIEEASRDEAHPERAKLAREALEIASGAKDRRALVRALEQGVGKTERLDALSRLQREGEAKLFDDLARVLQDGAFAARDPDEMEAFLEAFARAGKLRSVRVLTELATKKTRLFRRKETQVLSTLAQKKLDELRRR
jgi:hypothetical protein